MIARVLGVSFRQALRSVALTIFPLAFISLFAWAAAGSTTGNTTDPIRTAAWLFLGAHLIPFSLPIGKLTFLPLLAVLIPIWAIKRGFSRVVDSFSNPTGARLFFGIWYAILCELLAVASRHGGVSANLYLTPIFAFVIVLIASARPNFKRNAGFYFASYLFLVVLGVATIFFAVNLAEHWQTLRSISVVIAPGALGGVLFTALQLLYLPNIVLAGLSYLTGIGFTFGHGSILNFHQIALGQVPAIPVFAAIPDGTHKSLTPLVAIWLLFFVIIFLVIRRYQSSLLRKTGYVLEQGLRIFVTLGVIAFLSSGELLIPDLNPIGVIWWHLLAYLGIAYLAASILAIYIPAFIGKLKSHG